MVIVYDKLHGKITYKIETSASNKTFDFIKKYYGKENCIFRDQQDLRKFE